MSDATTLPPTLSIKDPDTRQFLDQLINVLDLRSGNKDPSSTDRFVTLGDLTSAFSGQSYGLSAPGSSSVSQAAQASQSAISSAIGDLTNSIQNSLVYRLLESPIDLIDIGPIRARLSQTEQASAAAIVNESEKRSNKDNALASAINTMWASIGGSEAVIQDGQLAQVTPAGVVATKWDQVQATIKDPVTGEYIASAAIKETAQTAVDKTGQLEAQYTVKVDVNGYVSGFGLASTANNSTPFSDFIVRADRFSIASPSGPGISPTVPFIVKTTPETLPNGTVVPPGVYMNYAMVNRLDGSYITAGLLDAATIYTGSQLIDRSSKQPLQTTGVTGQRVELIENAVQPYTSSSMRIYGSNYHGQVSVNQRVRNATVQNPVAISVMVSAQADHYFSLWFRLKNGPWQFLTKVVEDQSDYGSATIVYAVNTEFLSDWFIDFGVACTKEDGTPYNTGAFYQSLKDVTVVIQVINL